MNYKLSILPSVTVAPPDIRKVNSVEMKPSRPTYSESICSHLPLGEHQKNVHYAIT